MTYEPLVENKRRKWENSLEIIDGERKVQIGQMEVARLARK